MGFFFQIDPAKGEAQYHGNKKKNYHGSKDKRRVPDRLAYYKPGHKTRAGIIAEREQICPLAGWNPPVPHQIRRDLRTHGITSIKIR